MVNFFFSHIWSQLKQADALGNNFICQTKTFLHVLWSDLASEIRSFYLAILLKRLWVVTRWEVDANKSLKRCQIERFFNIFHFNLIGFFSICFQTPDNRTCKLSSNTYEWKIFHVFYVSITGCSIVIWEAIEDKFSISYSSFTRNLNSKLLRECPKEDNESKICYCFLWTRTRNANSELDNN